MKQTEIKQVQFDGIFQAHDDLDQALGKVLRQYELSKTPHDLPDVEQVIKDSMFGLQMDYENLMEKRILERYRGGNRGISVFLWKQGR